MGLTGGCEYYTDGDCFANWLLTDYLNHLLVADVGGLYDCLYGISSGQADESILDKYDEIRREKYLNVIDPISSGNLRRLWDPDAIENDEFIKMIKKADVDYNLKREMQHVRD